MFPRSAPPVLEKQLVARRMGNVGSMPNMMPGTTATDVPMPLGQRAAGSTFSVATKSPVTADVTADEGSRQSLSDSVVTPRRRRSDDAGWLYPAAPIAAAATATSVAALQMRKNLAQKTLQFLFHHDVLLKLDAGRVQAAHHGVEGRRGGWAIGPNRRSRRRTLRSEECRAPMQNLAETGGSDRTPPSVPNMLRSGRRSRDAEFLFSLIRSPSERAA